MITKLSYWLAKIIAEKADSDKVDYIRYGLEVVLGSLIKIIVFILLALYFDIAIEIFSIILSFIMLRVISGGVHMSTFLRCLTSSIILFFTPAYLLKTTAPNLNSFYFVLTAFFIALIIILRYVPVPAANRPIPVEKRLFFKWTSLLFMAAWLIVNILAGKYLSQYQYVSFYSAVGILLQTFTLTPFGYNLFHSIDHFLD